MCKLDDAESLPLLVFFKLLMLFVSLLWEAKLQHPRQMYYYHNLEIPRGMLWSVATAVDSLLFLFVMLFTHCIFL